MTREELNELRDSSKNDDQIVEILFDRLNDFKSRTCENCKHYVDDPFSMGSIQICDILMRGVAKDFGCNKFERMHDV